MRLRKHKTPAYIKKNISLKIPLQKFDTVHKTRTGVISGSRVLILNMKLDASLTGQPKRGFLHEEKVSHCLFRGMQSQNTSKYSIHRDGLHKVVQKTLITSMQTQVWVMLDIIFNSCMFIHIILKNHISEPYIYNYK